MRAGCLTDLDLVRLQRLSAGAVATLSAHAADCPGCLRLLTETLRSAEGDAARASTLAAAAGRAKQSEPAEGAGARYQIQEILGRGGMGIVYRAWDLVPFEPG